MLNVMLATLCLIIKNGLYHQHVLVTLTLSVPFTSLSICKDQLLCSSLTEERHTDFITLLITNDWGVSRPTNSLEKRGFASISSPNNENLELRKLSPNGSSAVRHGSVKWMSMHEIFIG